MLALRISEETRRRSNGRGHSITPFSIVRCYRDRHPSGPDLQRQNADRGPCPALDVTSSSGINPENRRNNQARRGSEVTIPLLLAGTCTPVVTEPCSMGTGTPTSCGLVETLVPRSEERFLRTRRVQPAPSRPYDSRPHRPGVSLQRASLLEEERLFKSPKFLCSCEHPPNGDRAPDPRR